MHVLYCEESKWRREKSRGGEIRDDKFGGEERREEKRRAEERRGGERRGGGEI